MEPKQNNTMNNEVETVESNCKSKTTRKRLVPDSLGSEVQEEKYIPK